MTASLFRIVEETQESQHDGTYRFDDLCEGAFRVETASRRYRRRVEIASEHADVDNLDFELDDGAILRGRIVPFEGRTPGETLIWSDVLRPGLPSPPPPPEATSIGAALRFRMEVPVGPIVVEVRTQSGGTGIFPFDLAQGEEREVELALGAGLSVSGTVIDDHGSPVPNASISCDWHYTTADDRGRFRLVGLRAHEQFLRAGTEAGPFTSGTTAIDLSDGASRESVIIELILRDQTLRGHVYYDDGVPVARQTITLRHSLDDEAQTAVTDDLGRFAVHRLPRGACELLPFEEGPDFQSRDVDCGEQHVQLVVDATRIEGELEFGADLDDSVSLPIIEARGDDGRTSSATIDGMHFVLPAFPGRVTIDASNSSLCHAPQTVDIRRGEVIRNMRLQLSRCPD